MTTTSKRKAAAAMASVVITADHVYLPVAAGGNVVEAWPAPNVSTSKVLRRTQLQVPTKLARFLCFRGQADILNQTTASEDRSSEAPTGA